MSDIRRREFITLLGHHVSRRSAPDVFGSPRWDASPIVRLCGVCDRLLLERGTLPGNVWDRLGMVSHLQRATGCYTLMMAQ